MDRTAPTRRQVVTTTTRWKGAAAIACAVVAAVAAFVLVLQVRAFAPASHADFPTIGNTNGVTSTNPVTVRHVD